MATAPVTHDEREFASEVTAVVEGYGQAEQQIQRLKDINVSHKLEAFLNNFHGRRDEASVFISNLVQKAANHYRRVEDEARRHVLKARDFAQENIDAVGGVNDNKYTPEEALDNFQDTGKHLKQSFDNLVEAYQEVLDYLKEAERKAKFEKDVWHKSEKAAGSVAQASLPFWGPVYGAQVVAEKAAASVDCKAGKVALRIAGGAAGMLGGLIASILVVPVVTSSILKLKYKSWVEEFCNIQDSLSQVDTIISEHKNTLGEICHHVDSLCKKYDTLKDKLESSKRTKMTLDQILTINKKLKGACKVFLEKIETEEGIAFPDSIARCLPPALQSNPTLPIQECSGDGTMEEAETEPCEGNNQLENPENQ